MKIIWLSTFPLNVIKEEAIFTQIPKSHPSSWVYNLAIEIAKDKNVEFHIITLTPHIYKDTNIKWNGISIWLVKCGLPIINKGYPGFFRFDIFSNYHFERRKMIKQIEKLKPDVIHIHGSEYAYTTLMPIYKDKSILSIQGVYSDFFKESYNISNIIQSRIEVSSVKRGIYFGVRTHYDSAFVRKINNKSQLLTLQEAISFDFFNQEWHLKDKNSILFVGSVIQRKGLIVLIKALALMCYAIPGIMLKIIGGIDQNYKSELDKIIDECNLNNSVLFLGSRSSSFIAEELAESTLFILPSYYENSPNSLAEAMVVGTPSIASDVGGISSMIEDGISGLLFKAGDEKMLAEKALKLLNNKDLMAEISKNARESSRKRHYPPFVAKQTLNAYRSMIDQ